MIRQKEIMREAYSELLHEFFILFTREHINEDTDKDNVLVMLNEKARYTYATMLGTNYNTLEEMYEVKGQFKLMKSLLDKLLTEAELWWFDTQAKLFVQKRHIPKLRKLFNFKFKRHPKFNIDEDVLKIMETAVEKRAAKIIEFYHDKERGR